MKVLANSRRDLAIRQLVGRLHGDDVSAKPGMLETLLELTFAGRDNRLFLIAVIGGLAGWFLMAR